jgi:hypothetical protein
MNNHRTSPVCGVTKKLREKSPAGKVRCEESSPNLSSFPPPVGKYTVTKMTEKISGCIY